ncbi:MAG: hypothetical protein MHM6MM_005560 [Cercozoa sp. M6MM]
MTSVVSTIGAMINNCREPSSWTAGVATIVVWGLLCYGLARLLGKLALRLIHVVGMLLAVAAFFDFFFVSRYLQEENWSAYLQAVWLDPIVQGWAVDRLWIGVGTCLLVLLVMNVHAQGQVSSAASSCFARLSYCFNALCVGPEFTLPGVLTEMPVQPVAETLNNGRAKLGVLSYAAATIGIAATWGVLLVRWWAIPDSNHCYVFQLIKEDANFAGLYPQLSVFVSATAFMVWMNLHARQTGEFSAPVLALFTFVSFSCVAISISVFFVWQFSKALKLPVSVSKAQAASGATEDKKKK